MKIRSLLLMAVIVLTAVCLPSCSSDQSADAGDIIATIPSDASLVAVANTKAILEKAGCKVNGEKITASKEVTSAIGNIKNPGMRKFAQALASGESGIDPSVTVVFQIGYYYYITGFLADPGSFKKAVKEDAGMNFEAQDGIDIAGNIAVSGNRYWVNLNQHFIDPKEVKHFTTLDESQSFMSNRYADRLCKISTDIEGWGNISGILRTLDMPFQRQATAQIALQTLFEDPASFSFSMTVNDNELKGDFAIINSKGNIAKYILPAENIDMKQVESIGGKGEMLFAVAIPNKLIKKLTEETSSKSPSMLGLYLQGMTGLDGTAAVAFNEKGDMKGVISTNGKNLSPLTMLLDEQQINVTRDGDALRISKGAAMDGAEISTLASPLKGAIAGVSMATRAGRPFKAAGISAFSLRQEGKGIKLSFMMRSDDKKENILLSALAE